VKKLILFFICSLVFSPAAESSFFLSFEGPSLVAESTRGDGKPTQAMALDRAHFTAGFDGKSSYLPEGKERPVYTANRAVPLPEGTVSFWFKPQNWPVDKAARFLHVFLPGKNKEVAILYFQRAPRGNDLWFRRVLSAEGKRFETKAVVPGAFVSPDSWQQVVCTWSAGEICIYLNGGLADRRAVPPEAAACAGFDPAWGSLSVLPVITADGDDPSVRTALDDLECFQGALTADEIKKRFLASLPGAVVPNFPAPKPAAAQLTLSKALEGWVDVDFPGAGGRVSLRDIQYTQPITPNECAFMVDAEVPVVVRIRSGSFPVVAGGAFAVNFSDRPPLYTNADASGILSIPLRGPSNYTGICVAGVDATDLLAGAPWQSRIDEVTNEFTGARSPCGSATRGFYEGAPSFRLEKTERDGRLAWESGAVAVSPGKEYLLTGRYQMAESAFGSKIRFQVVLTGPGLADRTVRENNLTHVAVPLLGAASTHSQVRVAVPAGYAKARVVLSLEGAAQSMGWTDLRFREAPHPLTSVPRGRLPEDGQTAATKEAVREIWASKPDRSIKVDKSGGFPVLRCDGRPVPLLFYNTGSGLPQHMETRAAVQAGVRLFVVPLSPPNKWWRGKEDYQFAEIQSNVEATLQCDPNALVVLATEVSPRYLAWGEENPEAVWRDHDGRKLAGYKTTLHKPDRLPPDSKEVWYFSYSAAEYRAQAAQAMRALAKHLKSFPAGKAVAGLMLWGGNDGQWQRPLGDMYEGWDYSPAAQRDFGRFLRERYGGSEAALRRAWSDPAAAFAAATLPTFDERNPPSWFLSPQAGPQRRVIDANLYGDEGVAQTIRGLGLAVKEAMGRDFLVFTYFHDSMEFGGRSSHRVLFGSGAIDAVVGIPSYSAYRTAGSPGQVTGALASYALHGMLHLSEYDVRTHVGHHGKDAYTILHYTHAGAENEEAYSHLMKRDTAMALTRGAGGWILCMPYYQLATPGYRAHTAAMTRVHSNLAARPLPSDRGQMAVYVDQELETVLRYGSSRALSAMSVSMPIRTAFGRSGVSFDSYFLSDVDHPARPKYRVHFFLTASTITPAQLAYVKGSLQRDGNVLVFCSGAGMASSAGPFETVVRELTGMAVRYDGATMGTLRTAPIPGSDRMAKDLKDNGEILWDQPLFYVDDPTATGFGRIMGANKIGWAVKRHAGWTGVYLATAGQITPELLRAIVAEAGLVPIGPNGDVTVAGNGLVALHALSGGMKALQLPEARQWVDLDSGEARAGASKRLEFPMRAGETRWFLRSAD